MKFGFDWTRRCLNDDDVDRVCLSYKLTFGLCELKTEIKFELKLLLGKTLKILHDELYVCILQTNMK